MNTNMHFCSRSWEAKSAGYLSNHGCHDSLASPQPDAQARCAILGGDIQPGTPPT